MHEFLAEYEKVLFQKKYVQQELAFLPNGYISEKQINGHNYYYLQSRTGGKVKSTYVKIEELEMVKRGISRRKQCENTVYVLSCRLKELETAAKLFDAKLSRDLLRLKTSVGIDLLSKEQKEKSISFASVMNEIEGVPASDETREVLNNWCIGKMTFLSAYEKTLKKYGFISEDTDAGSISL